MKKLKRLLFLFHRWLGVALCLWFALLFASGIIMMYVEYPELTEVERVDKLEPVQMTALHLSVSDAAARSGSHEFSSIKLSQVLGRPTYQLVDTSGKLTTIFADDGVVLTGLTPELAVLAVQRSGFVEQVKQEEGVVTDAAKTISQASYQDLLDIDQWTVSSALNASRPLHKVKLNDSAGTVLYVSDKSGQIVRDTQRTERFWNWLGSTVHWIYPWQLRRHATLWTNLLTYLSLAGVFSVVSGAVVGYWRLRARQRYRGKSLTPYQGFQKWHHLLGLGFLLFISTWIFSGLMSMSPWGLFDNATSEDEQVLRYQGGALSASAQFPTLGVNSSAISAVMPLKEIEWRRLGDTYYLVLSYSANAKEVLLPTAMGGTLIAPTNLQTLIESALPTLQPKAKLLEQEIFSHYDSYYYTHHNRYRPLPVLRVSFADAEQSWYYLDLKTGAVVQRLTHIDRWARWLYNGLHSLDFALLFQHRPLWDVSVIVLCLCGFSFAVTCVVIGWRRLKVSG